MDESSRRPRQVDGDGAAKRRRLRRLRSWWRHEQQTVAAVLATYQHHSAPRGPRTARTRGGARDELHGYAPEDASPRVPGHLVWASRGGHRHRYSGAPCSRSSTQSLWCLFSTILCRRWWTMCCTLFVFWIVRSPSRLSKSPRSRVHRVLPVCLYLCLRWRNSWRKCRPC